MSDIPTAPMSHNDPDSDIAVRSLCPLPHRGHAPQIHPPATMCDHHAEQLRHRCDDIARWWPDLDALAESAGGGVRGAMDSRPPVRLEVIALLDPNTAGGDIPNATATLTTIAAWITRTRRLMPVAGPTAALGRIRTHWVALTDHPDPEAVHGRLTRLWLYLRRLVGEHRHTVATCQQPHPDPQADGECGGPITWTGRTRGTIAVCGTCHDEWTDTVVDLYWRQQALREQTGTV